MKKLILAHIYILFMFAAVCCTAQTFDYERTWGTYLGGTNTTPVHLYENNQQQVILDGNSGGLTLTPAPPASYYNQFITSGAQGFLSNSNSLNTNYFTGVISSNATLQNFEYRTDKKIIHREKNGNYFAIADTGTPTAGVWLNNSVEPANNPNVRNRLLEKYDSNNNLIWRTYVPSMLYFENSYQKSILTDSSGNIYLSGLTLWRNLGDSGTAFPNFTFNTTPGIISPNVFVAKLNPQGQKIWATYLPCSYGVITSLYNNDLYVSSFSDINTTDSLLSTPGSFQQTKAETSITKINASTGARVWGTYYGNSNVQNSGVQSIVAQEDGVYVLGAIYNTMGNTNGYFASSDAFQSQSPGGEYDLYIAKFNTGTGNRVWGTYYGSPDNDAYVVSGSTNMDVKNGKILVTNVQNGNTNLSTSGAYQTTKPTATAYDIVFSMFNTESGSRIFTSYYGGPPINVNLAQIAASGKFSESEDAFYLYGFTTSQTQYTESNAIQANVIYPTPTANNGYTGYLAKFSSKTLGTAEASPSNDLNLYDNPNNGNFSISGTVLSSNNCILQIFDASGKLILNENLPRQKTQHFYLQKQLIDGVYLLKVITKDKASLKTFKMIVK